MRLSAIATHGSERLPRPEARQGEVRSHGVFQIDKWGFKWRG